MSVNRRLAGVLLCLCLWSQGALASGNEACYHNVVRDALSQGKTMRNLGPRLDQQYDFSLQNQPLTALPSMQYSTSLARSAANWASQCRFDHSHLQGVGENLFVGTETNLDPANWEAERKWRTQNAVNDWAFEARFLTVGSQTANCSTGDTCGHYTQMVWADTTEVGCAEQFCSSVTQNGQTIFNGRQATLIVCHYNPQGNYVQYIGGPYLTPYPSGGSASSGEAPLSCDTASTAPPPQIPNTDMSYIIQLLFE